jgi:hypothetical protein
MAFIPCPKSKIFKILKKLKFNILISMDFIRRPKSKVLKILKN